MASAPPNLSEVLTNQRSCGRPTGSSLVVNICYLCSTEATRHHVSLWCGVPVIDNQKKGRDSVLRVKHRTEARALCHGSTQPTEQCSFVAANVQINAWVMPIRGNEYEKLDTPAASLPTTIAGPARPRSPRYWRQCDGRCTCSAPMLRPKKIICGGYENFPTFPSFSPSPPASPPLYWW